MFIVNFFVFPSSPSLAVMHFTASCHLRFVSIKYSMKNEQKMAFNTYEISILIHNAMHILHIHKDCVAFWCKSILFLHRITIEHPWNMQHSNNLEGKMILIHNTHVISIRLIFWCLFDRLYLIAMHRFILRNDQRIKVIEIRKELHMNGYD